MGKMSLKFIQEADWPSHCIGFFRVDEMIVEAPEQPVFSKTIDLFDSNSAWHEVRRQVPLGGTSLRE